MKLFVFFCTIGFLASVLGQSTSLRSVQSLVEEAQALNLKVSEFLSAEHRKGHTDQLQKLEQDATAVRTVLSDLVNHQSGKVVKSTAELLVAQQSLAHYQQQIETDIEQAKAAIGGFPTIAPSTIRTIGTTPSTVRITASTARLPVTASTVPSTVKATTYRPATVGTSARPPIISTTVRTTAVTSARPVITASTSRPTIVASTTVRTTVASSPRPLSTSTTVRPSTVVTSTTKRSVVVLPSDNVVVSAEILLAEARQVLYKYEGEHKTRLEEEIKVVNDLVVIAKDPLNTTDKFLVSVVLGNQVRTLKELLGRVEE